MKTVNASASSNPPPPSETIERALFPCIREIADTAIFNSMLLLFPGRSLLLFFMRQEITSISKMDAPESSKTSTSAGKQGQISNQIIDEIVLDLVMWLVQSSADFCPPF